MNVPSNETGNRTISSLYYLAKKKQYEVCFGLEKVLLSEDRFTDYYLYVGKSLSAFEFRQLERESREEKLYQYALKLSLGNSRSSFEIWEKIKAKAKEDENPKEIFARLKKNGFLDDRSYAEDYAERKSAEGYGRERILYELRENKHVDSAILADLSFPNEEEKATQCAASLEKRFARCPLAKKKEKAYQALLRRGFSPSLARKACANYHEDHEAAKQNFERDFVTLYQRYARQYQKGELKKHLFDGLYRKGYKMEMIEERWEEEKC